MLAVGADVYSLGFELGTVAEETWGDMHNPVWHDRTPGWYRDIVRDVLLSIQIFLF